MSPILNPPPTPLLWIVLHLAFKKKFFFNLAALALSCGTQDLRSSWWHGESLVAVCELLGAACES